MGEMETSNQNVKSETTQTSVSVKTEKKDESNNHTEPILIEDDVKLEETPSWNEIDKWIDADQDGDIEMEDSGQANTDSKSTKIEKEVDVHLDEDEEEEPAGDVKSEFA